MTSRLDQAVGRGGNRGRGGRGDQENQGRPIGTRELKEQAEGEPRGHGGNGRYTQDDNG